jgi:hypothetical protein
MALFKLVAPDRLAKSVSQHTGKCSHTGRGRYKNAHRHFPRRSETNSGLIVLQSLRGKRDDIGPRPAGALVAKRDSCLENALGIWNTVNGNRRHQFLAFSIFLPFLQSCRFRP